MYFHLISCTMYEKRLFIYRFKDVSAIPICMLLLIETASSPCFSNKWDDGCDNEEDDEDVEDEEDEEDEEEEEGDEEEGKEGSIPLLDGTASSTWWRHRSSFNL